MPKYRKRRRRKDKHPINQYIRSSEVRVIDTNDDNLGVMNTKEAVQLAKSKDLDLVVVAEKAKPPVARILDYRKFLYEENKKASAAKAKSKKSELKEFRFGPSIGEADLDLRIQRAKEFIEDGNRVRFTARLRGRERKFPEIAFEKFDTIHRELEKTGKREKEPILKGNKIEVTYVKI